MRTPMTGVGLKFVTVCVWGGTLLLQQCYTVSAKPTSTPFIHAQSCLIDQSFLEGEEDLVQPERGQQTRGAQQPS